jgi:hypothetical protein
MRHLTPICCCDIGGENPTPDRAMPTTEQRADLAKERDRVVKRATKNDRAIERLVDAIANGADVGLLLGKQGTLKNERDALTERLQELDAELVEMPSAEQVQAAANLTRMRLMAEHWGKDWRKLPYDEIQRFLHHLFGDSVRGSKNGVFVRRNGDILMAEFVGRVDFAHLLRNGQPIMPVFYEVAAQLNKNMEAEYERAIAALKPCTVNK